MSASAHVRASLAVLAVFLAGGIWLEAMHGLRSRGLLDDELQREFLRLGHAHGGILSVTNLVLAWGLERLATPEAWARRIRVAALAGAASVGLGFIGGGLWHGPTDPGPIVLAVPAGAMSLLAALVAAALLRRDDPVT